MLNSAEVTIGHRKAYTRVDQYYKLKHQASFWVHHPIFAWSLHYGKQPWLPYPDEPFYLSYKVLSNKWHVVAFRHRDYPGISYVPDIITPENNAKIHREMTAFWKHYAALEASRESDYIMDDPNQRGKRYSGTTYQTRNR